MDRINYDQTEGFPLDVNILDFGQKANQITQQLGEIIAPLAIVKGCVENGNNVGDGLVYINGEILPFKGALKQNVVRIVESSESRVFENGNSKPVLVTRYATFGAGAGTTYNFADFYRSPTIKQIDEKINDKTAFDKLVERVSKLEVFARPFSAGGGMVFFNKPINEIPEGWREVENWRGRIPMHFDPNDENLNNVGEIYGDKTRTLTTGNLPRNKYGTNFGAEIKSDGKPNYLSGFGPGTDIYLGNNESFSIVPPVKIAIFIEPIP